MLMRLAVAWFYVTGWVWPPGGWGKGEGGEGGGVAAQMLSWAGLQRQP